MESYTAFKIVSGLKPSPFTVNPSLCLHENLKRESILIRGKARGACELDNKQVLGRELEVCPSSSTTAAWPLCKWGSRCTICRGRKLGKVLRDGQISTLCLGETGETSTVALCVLLPSNDNSHYLTGLLWGFIELCKVLRTNFGIEKSY